MPPKGCKLSEESKQKIRDARAKQVFTEQTRNKMSIAHKGLMAGSKHPLFGIPRTDEQRKHQSDIMKGERNPNFGKPLSEETRKKLSLVLKGRTAPFKGRKHSVNAIEKQSKCKKGQLNPMYGKHFSEEHRKKISFALKGRKLTSEWKNKLSQSGIELNAIGDKNPNWKGGISFEPYCHKFNNRLKERIRERDNRECQLCGVKENGKKLNVHHIHYDKKNCGPDLITLCNVCNSKVNGNRDYWEYFFMELLKKRGLLL